MNSLGCFGFQVKTNMRFGAGLARDLPAHLQEDGIKRAGLVVDAGVLRNPAWQDIQGRLATTFDVTTLECTVSEPDYDYLDDCKLAFEGKDIQCVIGVGGGSVLDIAKAISVLVTNPGPAIQYRGFNLVKNPGPAVIAIPTTAGTGSEVTPNAVFTDKKEMRKLGINSPLYLPKLALLDPLLTVTCPRQVTISSGMDALVHALESFVAQAATPVSRMFSKEALSLIFKNLPLVVDEPDNVEWRGQMQLGAYLAGVALMNSAAGPAGAMSYPLGVHFRVPHGLAGAVFLPKVARFNVEMGCTKYADLYDLLAGSDQGASSLTKSEMFCRRLEELCSTLDIPPSLDGFGVTRGDIAMMAEQTMLLKGALNQNPIPFSVGEATALLERMV